jgi:predicted amidohydrolase
MSGTTRDAVAAREKAAERIARAQRISDAVEAFHSCADEIEAAQRTIAEASARRVGALREMRDAGLSIAEISEMTSLSPSRIQALVRGESEHTENGAGPRPEADIPTQHGNGGGPLSPR